MASTLDTLDCSFNPLTSLDALPEELPCLVEVSVRGCLHLQSLDSLRASRFPEVGCLDAADSGVNKAMLLKQSPALAKLTTLWDLDVRGCTGCAGSAAPLSHASAPWLLELLPSLERLNGEVLAQRQEHDPSGAASGSCPASQAERSQPSSQPERSAGEVMQHDAQPTNTIRRAEHSQPARVGAPVRGVSSSGQSLGPRTDAARTLSAAAVALAVQNLTGSAVKGRALASARPATPASAENWAAQAFPGGSKGRELTQRPRTPQPGDRGALARAPL